MWRYYYISFIKKFKIKYISWVNPINNPEYISYLNNIDDEYINNCKIITFSRNPYERILSAIKYIFNLRNIKINKNSNLINILYDNSKLKISDIHHYIPSNLITNNKNIYTKIYKFENFDEDVKKFLKNIYL